MSEESDGKFTSPLRVTLFEREIEFASAAEILTFVEHDQNYWESLIGPTPDKNRFTEIIGRAQQSYRQIVSVAQSFIGGKIADRDVESRIRGPIDSLYATIPPYNDPRAQALAEIYGADPDTAAATITFLKASSRTHRPTNVTTKDVGGAIAATMIRLGLGPQVATAEVEALRATQDNWRNFRDHARFDHAENEAEAKVLRDEVAGLKAQLEEQFSAIVEEHEAQVKQIRGTFRQEMSLQAPVEYWEDKASRHRTGFTALIVVAALLLIGAAILLYQLIPSWLNPLSGGVELAGDVPSTDAPNYYTILFWLS